MNNWRKVNIVKYYRKKGIGSLYQCLFCLLNNYGEPQGIENNGISTFYLKIKKNIKMCTKSKVLFIIHIEGMFGCFYLIREGKMNISDLKRELIGSDDEKKVEIIIYLISLIKKDIPNSTNNFIQMCIAFVTCHLSSESRYSGLYLFNKLVVNIYPNLNEWEKKDIQLQIDYYSYLFQYNVRCMEELNLLCDQIGLTNDKQIQSESNSM